MRRETWKEYVEQPFHRTVNFFTYYLYGFNFNGDKPQVVGCLSQMCAPAVMRLRQGGTESDGTD